MSRLACLALVVLCAGAFAAQERPRGPGAQRPERPERPDRGELREEFRKELMEFAKGQFERRRAHYEKQMEENKAFADSIKTEEPQAIVFALKGHRETQFNENKAFAAQQQQRREDFLNSFADRHNLPAEFLDKALARCEEVYSQGVNHFTTQHNENMALLDKLAADPSLTRESLRQAIKEQIEKQRAENKAFLEQFGRRLKGLRDK
jgi:hypothetical protein